jgi:hypothetical protein
MGRVERRRTISKSTKVKGAKCRTKRLLTPNIRIACASKGRRICKISTVQRKNMTSAKGKSRKVFETALPQLRASFVCYNVMPWIYGALCVLICWRLKCRSSSFVQYLNLSSRKTMSSSGTIKPRTLSDTSWNLSCELHVAMMMAILISTPWLKNRSRRPFCLLRLCR